MKGRAAVFAVGLVGASFGATTAYAASVSIPGSRAENSGNTLTVTDTACDGDNEAYANWNNSTGNRVQAAFGCGTSNSVTVSSLNSFRACVDRPNNSDPCSSWVFL